MVNSLLNTIIGGQPETKKKHPNPIGGDMGFFDLETDNFDPDFPNIEPGFRGISEGSLFFDKVSNPLNGTASLATEAIGNIADKAVSTVTNTAKATGEAFWDLGKDIIGIQERPATAEELNHLTPEIEQAQASREFYGRMEEDRQSLIRQATENASKEASRIEVSIEELLAPPPSADSKDAVKSPKRPSTLTSSSNITPFQIAQIRIYDIHHQANVQEWQQDAVTEIQQNETSASGQPIVIDFNGQDEGSRARGSHGSGVSHGE